MTVVEVPTGTDRDVVELARAHQRIVDKRDDLIDWLDGLFAEYMAKFDAAEAGAPRHMRRRVARARRGMVRLRDRCAATLDRHFEQVTRGFDLEGGTLAGVKEEASAMLEQALRDV